jgi:adenosylhomocysteine nucleosidase
MRRLFAVVLGATIMSSCVAIPGPDPRSPRPLLVQGALEMEIARLREHLADFKIERAGAWTFWQGTVDGYPVIISKTGMGASNAAAATAFAIDRYQPIAIINQGTSGGHDPSLHVYDIVIGTAAVSLAAFRTPHKLAGTGSDALEWVPLDLSESVDTAADGLREDTIARFEADRSLLDVASRVKHLYHRGRVVEGVIGSSEVWNEELDRIARFRAAHDTAVEEMETAPAAQIAALFKVPFLGIRVVSANIVSDGAYDPKTSDACQDYVFQVVKAYIASLRRATSSTQPPNTALQPRRPAPPFS